MGKKIAVGIAVLVLLLLGVAGVYMYTLLHTNTSTNTIPPKSTPATTKPLHGSTNTPQPPTEVVTYPDGRQQTVIAHQLLARINDAATVKSFGSKIKESNTKGVYVITVEGDLLQAKSEVKAKPGVVWVDTIAIAPN